VPRHRSHHDRRHQKAAHDRRKPQCNESGNKTEQGPRLSLQLCQLRMKKRTSFHEKLRLVDGFKEPLLPGGPPLEEHPCGVGMASDWQA